MNFRADRHDIATGRQKSTSTQQPLAASGGAVLRMKFCD